MPITLTFDTPEELQAFFQQGGLEGVTVKKTRGRKKATATATPAAKPGRPGRKKAAVKPAAKKGRPGRPKKAVAAKAATVGKKAATTKKTAAKKVVKVAKVAKPAKAVKVPKAAKPKKAAAKVGKVAKAPKTRGPRANGRLTLTSKIKDTIQGFLSSKKPFTANDVYDEMAKQDKGINKQSVITSVLKQMNSTFANIKVTERPGAGPRPVKLYNA